MRGKAVGVAAAPVVTGITPACAGKSHDGNSGKAGREDHPRMCGEKKPTTPVTVRCIGSPPRMRGKVKMMLDAGCRHRITPACAGKRRWPGCSGGSAEDHPRVCGEKLIPPRIGFWLRGSPPHVRGEAGSRKQGKRAAGITPACAGKSQGLNIFHTKRSSGPLPAAMPAGPAGSCPASRPSQFPPRMTVISPRP